MTTVTKSVHKRKAHPHFPFPEGVGGAFRYDEIFGDYDPTHEAAEPHTHDYYIMGFLLSGSLELMIDFQNIEVAAPAVMLMTNEQLHRHLPFHDCHLITIYFSPDLLFNKQDDFYEKTTNVFLNPIIHLDSNTIERIQPYLALLKVHSNSVDASISRLLLQIILQLCDKAIEKSGPAQNDYRKRGLYQDFNVALQRHIRIRHQVSFYASLLHVTTETLNVVVKLQTGKTPKQIIDQRLVTHAKGLLYWYDQTVREVAWALGFETDAYFNRFFKKHTGMTPKEYQRNHNFG